MFRNLKALVPVFSALTLAVASGCGSGSATDKTVAGANAVVQEWIDDIQNGHYTAACALMSKAARDNLNVADGGCAVALLTAMNMSQDRLGEGFQNMKATRIDGDRAYGSSDVLTDEQLAIWEDGRWRIDADQ